MKQATQNLNRNRKPQFEKLEDRRLMSQVSLVDGMLIVQGNANGNNRLGVTRDEGGKTFFARSNGVKEHYDISEVKSIYLIGGEKTDTVFVERDIDRNAYVRVGSGDDLVETGAGSDTIFGGNGADSLRGNEGDDLIVGAAGPDKINAGANDNPNSISAAATSKLKVDSFTLVDATTNKVVGTLANGAQLDLATLPKRMNVKANLSGGDVGSVLFSFDGQKRTQFENAAPYVLAGDNNGDFSGWTPRVGSHTLTATPFSKDNGGGLVGSGKTITFTVVNNAVVNPETPPDDTTPTDTKSDDTTSDNPTVDDTAPDSTDSDAPRAVIDVMDASVAAGQSIQVNGVSSTLNSGDALGATYDWDFGDPAGKYNKLTGFNAAHAYDKAGTYTITLRVTNSAGKATTTTSRVTITPAARTAIYVSSDGNDSNTGRGTGTAVKTFARAAQLVDDNTEVLFERGGTYMVSDTMKLANTNVVVGAYGTGAKPVMKYNGSLNYNAIFSTFGGKDVTIRDLAFDSVYTTDQEEGYNAGVNVGGTNSTVRDCSFINVGYAINTNGQPEGFLAQDNDCPNVKGLRAYFAWVQGSDQVYLGNKVLDSVQSHVLRMAGADRVLIANNDFTNLAATAMRPTITLHKGSYVYVTGNKFTGSAVGIGPLNAGSGLNDIGARLKWAVLEKNIITDSPINLSHGVEGISIRDNVINRDNGVAFDLSGYSSQYQRGTKDVYIIRNTVLNSGVDGRFIKVGGMVQDVTLSYNLYYAPNLKTGQNQNAPVSITTSDLSGFREISNNIWPEVTILRLADGGINYVGSAGDSSGYKTAAEWEAYSQVKNDMYKDVTLTTSYKVSLGGITAGANMSRAA
jgi:hypothetical protein